MTEKLECIKIKSEIQFKVCRLCLEDSEILISIESQRKNMKIQSVLELLSSSKITDLAHTPRNICVKCLSRLDVVIEMIEMCKRSEEILKDLREPDYDGFIASYLNNTGPLIETGWKPRPEEIAENNMADPFDYWGDFQDNEDEIKRKPEEPSNKSKQGRKTDYKKLSAAKLVAKGILKNPRKGRAPKPLQICVICGQSFKYLSELTAHEICHTLGQKPFSCDICGAGLKTKMNVIGHMSVVHLGQQRFTCKICGKVVKKTSSFNYHMNTHTKTQKYVCEFPVGDSVCGKIFWRKNLKILHQRTHTGQRPYKCQEAGCGKAYAYNSDLKRHMVSHTGIMPYKCKVCSKGFMRKNQMESHERSHSASLGQVF